MAGRSASLKAEVDAMAALERVMRTLSDKSDPKTVDRVTTWYVDTYATPDSDGAPDAPPNGPPAGQPTPQEA